MRIIDCGSCGFKELRFKLRGSIGDSVLTLCGVGFRVYWINVRDPLYSLGVWDSLDLCRKDPFFFFHPEQQPPTQ